MYLLDTPVIIEARKGQNADAGVREFFDEVVVKEQAVYLSVLTLGQLRLGIERIKYRGDRVQAETLAAWLDTIVTEYDGYVLDFNYEIAQVWGKLKSLHDGNLLLKQFAATALIYDLTMVSGNADAFKACGVRVRNPFCGDSAG